MIRQCKWIIGIWTRYRCGPWEIVVENSFKCWEWVGRIPCEIAIDAAQRGRAGGHDGVNAEAELAEQIPNEQQRAAGKDVRPIVGGVNDVDIVGARTSHPAIAV